MLCVCVSFCAYVRYLCFPGGSDGKASVCNEGDPGLIPGSRRSPGEGNGNPLQYTFLENLMNRGAWQTTVHGVERVGLDFETKPLLLSHFSPV